MKVLHTLNYEKTGTKLLIQLQMKREISGFFLWSKVFLDKGIANRTIGQSLRHFQKANLKFKYNQKQKEGRGKQFSCNNNIDSVAACLTQMAATTAYHKIDQRGVGMSDYDM